jgi:hypothetical protein
LGARRHANTTSRDSVKRVEIAPARALPLGRPSGTRNRRPALPPRFGGTPRDRRRLRGAGSHLVPSERSDRRLETPVVGSQRRANDAVFGGRDWMG